MLSKKAALQALLHAVLCVGCLSDLLDWQALPDDIEGRINIRHPSPRCCEAHDCLLRDRGHYAFVTTVRSPDYLVLARELHCSLTKYNKAVEFIVAAVKGDLNETVIDEVSTFATYKEIEDFGFKNDFQERFGKNWCKLRIFGWVDYDAIVLMDADLVVRGDLTHLFKLPTPFAMVMESGPGFDYMSGGFLFLRPCEAVANHMMKLPLENERLRFADGFAEQQYLQWYFKNSGMRLSSMYNADSEMLRVLGEETGGGENPLVIHFAFWKPFRVLPGDPRYKHLCWQPQQHALRIARGESIEEEDDSSQIPDTTMSIARLVGKQKFGRRDVHWKLNRHAHHKGR